MLQFVIVVIGSHQWRCTFYPLVQLLVGEVGYGVGHAAQHVRVGILRIVKAVEGCEACEYRVPFAISHAIVGGGLLFWNLDYPEVVELTCALDNLYA